MVAIPFPVAAIHTEVAATHIAEAAGRTAAVAPVTPEAVAAPTRAAVVERITAVVDPDTMEDAAGAVVTTAESASASMAALITAMGQDITAPAMLLRIRATRQDTTTNTETGKSIQVVTLTRTNLGEGCPHGIEALGHSSTWSLLALHLE